jgi:putative transposase
MPRRPRVSTTGLIFHVVNRAAKRAALFESPADYDAFERVLAAAVARGDVALFAYCVMPNHWHLLLSPLVDGGLSRFMHWLTTTHARRWQTARDLDGQGAVYQGRFRSIPVASDAHFLWVSRYIERNPLRAALVGRAEDWPWSSMARRALDPATGWLAEWPVMRPLDWIPLVNQPQTTAELDAFRAAADRGEPFGDSDWRRSTMIRLGTWPPRARGRPRKKTPDPITDTLPTGSQGRSRR